MNYGDGDECTVTIAQRTLFRGSDVTPRPLRKPGLPALSLRWYVLFSHTGASSVTNDPLS